MLRTIPPDNQAVIWIDITYLRSKGPHTTGAPRVVRAIIAALAKEPNVSFCIYSAHRRCFFKCDAPLGFQKAPGYAVKKTPTSKKIKRSITRIYPLIGLHYLEPLRRLLPLRRRSFRFGKTDVLFLPFVLRHDERHHLESIMASSRAPTLVAMIHDLIPMVVPDKFPWMGGEFIQYAEFCLRQCRHLIVPSVSTANDVRAHLQKMNQPELNIHIIREADVIDTPAFMSERLVALQEKKFVVSVAHLTAKRKNLPLLCDVWRLLLSRDDIENVPLLVLAGFGAPDEDFRHINRAEGILTEHVMIIPNPTDAELAWLYQHSLFTMMPSVYEGWGLPVAESLTFGKYCIASNTSSLPEIGGDLVGYHDPHDVEACYKLVAESLHNPAGLREKEERIRREYTPTSIDRFGENLYQILRSL